MVRILWGMVLLGVVNGSNIVGKWVARVGKPYGLIVGLYSSSLFFMI